MDYRKMAEDFLEELCQVNDQPENKNISGVSKGEIAVLSYLVKVKDYATPGEISCHRQLTSARIANTLASLEKKGLVERLQDTVDRRKVLVHITDQGRNLAHEKMTEALDSMERLLRALGEEDSLELIRLNRKIRQLHKEGKI